MLCILRRMLESKLSDSGDSISYKIACASTEDSGRAAYPDIISRTHVFRVKKA